VAKEGETYRRNEHLAVGQASDSLKIKFIEIGQVTSKNVFYIATLGSNMKVHKKTALHSFELMLKKFTKCQ